MTPEEYRATVARILSKRFTALTVAGRVEIHARAPGSNALMCGKVVRDWAEMPFHPQLTCPTCRGLWEQQQAEAAK